MAVPLEKISCIHLNDSKFASGSHSDRHTVIGEGKIPLQSLSYIATYDKFYDIPKIIETPQTDDNLTFPKEIKKLLS